MSKSVELNNLLQRILRLHPGFETESIKATGGYFEIAIKRIRLRLDGSDAAPTYRLMNELMDAVQQAGFQYLGGSVRMLGIRMHVDTGGGTKEFKHSAGMFRLRRDSV